MKTALPIAFDCDRTCPAHEARDYCRFNRLFALAGITPTVTSHTVKIKMDMDDPAALESAVKALGWKWHGHKAKHDMGYGNYATGHGFTPANWYNMAVLESNGEIAYDDMSKAKQLDQLRAAYAIGQAENAAKELGWLTERTPAGLTVHHPEGGILTVSKDAVCETTGFIGQGCHAAREALGLLADGAAQNKPEYGQTAAQIQTGS